jgi:hypothetical protein
MTGTQIVIVNLATTERIPLQNVPLTLDHNPRTRNRTIMSSGANHPKYHYTGGEELLKFQTTFYCDEETRKSVVETCRKLEALAKNDSYKKKRPPLYLSWGESLYDGFKWVMLDLSYVYNNFNGEYDGYPMGASVEITLGRITESNLSHEEIRTTLTPFSKSTSNNDPLAGLPGAP